MRPVAALCFKLLILLTEREGFHWTYFEEEGNLGALTEGSDAEGHPIISTMPGAGTQNAMNPFGQVP
jgi:hypothetical protein